MNPDCLQDLELDPEGLGDHDDEVYIEVNLEDE